jgi:hypothetical protein
MLGEREQQVRDNLKLLHTTTAGTDVKKQLETKLADLEKQLDSITAEFVKLTEERAKLNEQLAAAIKQVTLKKK